MRMIHYLIGGTTAVFSSLVAAAESMGQTQTVFRYTGVSGIWMLANISYAGMRAQSNPHRGWRITSFIFGSPGTLVSDLAVKEGSERVYGFDLPRKS